jgi:predicted deacylase
VIAERLGVLPAGSREAGRLRLGELASGTPLELPYLILRGIAARPCLWVNSNVHGDESQAAITAIRFARETDPAVLSGSIVVTPVANPTAFDARRKHSPLDNLDLDQSFPGRATGFTTQLVAAGLFAEAAASADALVSLHTMGPFLDATLYAVYKRPPLPTPSEEALLRLIAAFEPFVACRQELDGAGELPGHIAGGIDYQLLCLGRPAFMIELGAGGRYQRERVEAGLRGLTRLAAALGVQPDAGTRMSAQRSPLVRVTARSHVSSRRGGFFEPAVQPGDRLEAGELFGSVMDVTGETVEEVRFERTVLVIGARRDPVVHSGDRIGFIATEWDEPRL